MTAIFALSLLNVIPCEQVAVLPAHRACLREISVNLWLEHVPKVLDIVAMDRPYGSITSLKSILMYSLDLAELMRTW